MKNRHVTCIEALRMISLGESGAEKHLSNCSSCLSEAERIKPVLLALRTEPDAEVPADLDHAIHAMLTAKEPPFTSRLSLPVALTLSTAATALLIAGATITLVNMYPVGQALARGAFLGVAYLVLSSAAALPLFLKRSRTPLRTQRWT